MKTKEVEAATLELSDDGTFTATTGCSELTGSWEEDDSVITTSGVDEDGDCSGDEQGHHLLRVLSAFDADEQADILTLFGVEDARKLGAIYSKE